MSEVFIGNKSTGKAPRKTHKQRQAERKEFFSLKAYLYKKAQLRALKLQFREARRAAKKDGKSLTFADYVDSLQQAQAHVHTHDHTHDHAHEELEVIDQES